jgi:hypothetical protein
MPRNILLILYLMLSCCAAANSQNLIGYSKDEIIAHIAQHEPDFELTGDRERVGLMYKVYNKDEVGRIFLLDKNNICYAYQIAFAYDKINYVISDLNSLYVKVNDFKWLDYSNKITSELNLIREENLFFIKRTLKAD